MVNASWQASTASGPHHPHTNLSEFIVYRVHEDKKEGVQEKLDLNLWGYVVAMVISRAWYEYCRPSTRAYSFWQYSTGIWPKGVRIIIGRAAEMARLCGREEEGVGVKGGGEGLRGRGYSQ